MSSEVLTLPGERVSNMACLIQEAAGMDASVPGSEPSSSSSSDSDVVRDASGALPGISQSLAVIPVAGHPLKHVYGLCSALAVVMHGMHVVTGRNMCRAPWQRQHAERGL